MNITTKSISKLPTLPEGFVLYDQVQDEILRVNEEIDDGFACVVAASNDGEVGRIVEIPHVDSLANGERWMAINNAPDSVRLDFLSIRISQMEQSQMKIASLLDEAL
jgi:hypothetical protein